MLKYLLIISVIFFPSSAFASSSSVSVTNDVNTSNSNTSESNVNTNIRIETNGEVTTYTSDKDESVEINVIDGVSEIKVDGEIIEDEEKNSTTSPTLTPQVDEDVELEEKNIFEFFGDFFKSIFSLLV